MKPLIPLKIAAFEKEFILKIVKKGGHGDNCLFGDMMGYSANDLMKAGRFNCTVIETDTSEGYGHLNVTSGKYDGMNGLVQAGGADFGLATQMIPMETDDFKYGPILSYSRITVLSSYAKFDPSLNEQIDISQVFNDISLTVFILLAAFLLLFVSLLALGKRLLGSTDRTNSIWTVTTFVCDQDSFTDDSRKFYIFFVTILALFVFWFLQYFSNFMTTELVRPRIPKTIDSFEDILHYRLVDKPRDYVDDRQVHYTSKDKVKKLPRPRPLFLKVIRSIKFFEFAEAGSVNRRVFDQAVEMNGGRSESQIDVRDGISSGLAIASGAVVFVDAETILRMIRVTICNVITQDRSFIFARNASIPYMLGYVYSKNISPETQERLDSVLYGFAESGLANKLVYELSTAIMPITHKIDMCLKDEVEISAGEHKPLDISHLSIIFRTSVGSLSMAFFVLLCELICDKCSLMSKRRVKSSTGKSSACSSRATRRRCCTADETRRSVSRSSDSPVKWRPITNKTLITCQATVHPR